MLSIVVPTYNAKDKLELMIASLFATTESEFELILIDDCSPDLETRKFIEDLESPQVTITKIFNPEHKWTNYAWNLGALIAKGEYIAILNSDIILSKGWDTPLIKSLADCTIACPYEILTNNQKTFRQGLHPLIAKCDPGMIKGAAFMFKKADYSKLFPIPQSLKHWCGDNWLADGANQILGVKFVDGSTIKHFGSVSSKTLPQELYMRRILQDMEQYEHISDKSLRPIKEELFGHK